MLIIAALKKLDLASNRLSEVILIGSPNEQLTFLEGAWRVGWLHQTQRAEPCWESPEWYKVGVVGKDYLSYKKSTLIHRLKKMAAQKGTKSVLDYIRANCPKVSRVRGTVQLETGIASGWRWRRSRRSQRGERQRKEREGQEQGESRARGQRSGPGDLI